eukprot:m51a1_g920 hypothetical protein (283) ;mRNA; f:185620-186791
MSQRPANDPAYVAIDAAKCVRCNQCVKDCVVGVISAGADGATPQCTASQRCFKCYHCISVCPTGALSLKGVEPEAVLPALTQEQRATPDQVAALIRERRSVRAFAKAPVARDVMMTLLRRASPAPTGHNKREIRWAVIETPAVLDEIRRLTCESWRKLAAEPDNKHARAYAGFVKAYESGNDIVMRSAPQILAAFAPAGGRMEDIDTTIALETAELVATTMGLGTCWGGFVLEAYALYEPMQALFEGLGVPKGSKMQCLLIGTPAVHYHRSVDRGMPPVSFH